MNARYRRGPSFRTARMIFRGIKRTCLSLSLSPRLFLKAARNRKLGAHALSAVHEYIYALYPHTRHGGNLISRRRDKFPTIDTCCSLSAVRNLHSLARYRARTLHLRCIRWSRASVENACGRVLPLLPLLLHSSSRTCTHVRTHRPGLKARKLALLPSDKCRREKEFARLGDSSESIRAPLPLRRERERKRYKTRALLFDLARALEKVAPLVRYVLFITHYCRDCRFICCGRLLLCASRR